MRQFMFGYVVYLLCGVLPTFGESRTTSDSACYFGTHAGTRGHTIVNTFPRVDCGEPGINEHRCEARGCCYDDTHSNTYHCFFKNNHPSNKNSERVCDNGAPSKRSECGWPGINKNICESRGCCWDHSVPGKKFCFYKSKFELRTNPIIDVFVSSCNNGVPFKRSACDYQGIREADCTKNGCCWDDSVPNALFCFHKFKKETLLTYSEKDCEALGLLKGCNDIRALGEIQKSDKYLESTFGGRTDVFAHEGGVGASAHAHLADISQKLGPFELGVNVGKDGAQDYATLDKGVGLGLSATLAEAGGGVGLKTPGLGKVGLSADDTAVKFKILGSGVSVSSSKGVELCLFGSCVWIG